MFKPSDLIVILTFLHNLNTACESSTIHEDAAMLLFPHFMTEPAKAALSYIMSATEDNTTHKEATLTAYCQVVKYLLETNATDDVIAGAEADIMNYKQTENMSAIPYSEKI